jgi:hypothetical protein
MKFNRNYLSIFVLAWASFLFFNICNSADNRTRNAIIILNHKGKCNYYSPFGIDATVSYFSVAVAQRAAPIITTGGIVYNFLSKRKRFNENLKNDSKSAEKFLVDSVKKWVLMLDESPYGSRKRWDKTPVGHKDLTEFMTKEAKIADAYFDYVADKSRWKEIMSADIIKESYILWQTPFDENLWDIYKHVSSDICLLIPKTRKEDKLTSDMVGFDLDSKYLEKISVDSVLSTWKPVFKKTFKNFFGLISSPVDWAPIKDMFLNKEKDIGKWNIFLIGHGSSPFKPTRKKVEKILKKKIHEEKKKKKESNRIIYYEKMLERLQDEKTERVGEDISLIEKEPWVAGMESSKFTSFLKFLNEGIITRFLFYLTCFGGGKHLQKASFEKLSSTNKDVIKPLNLNYIVSVGSVAEVSVTVMTPIAELFNWRGLLLAPAGHYPFIYRESFDKNDPAYPLSKLRSYVNFNGFFNSLRSLFGFWTSIKKKQGFSISPFKSILHNVAPYISGIGYAAIPSIKLPGTNFFQAIDIDNDVQILSHMSVKNYELENRIIGLRDKSVALLYPSIVRVPMSVWSGTSFVSMNPGVALHFINKIQCSDNQFSIFNLDSRLAVKKFFVVKEIDHFPSVVKDNKVERGEKREVLKNVVAAFGRSGEEKTTWFAVYKKEDKFYRSKCKKNPLSFFPKYSENEISKERAMEYYQEFFRRYVDEARLQFRPVKQDRKFMSPFQVDDRKLVKYCKKHLGIPFNESETSVVIKDLLKRDEDVGLMTRKIIPAR